VPAAALSSGVTTQVTKKHRKPHRGPRCNRKRRRHLRQSLKPTPARCRANPTPARVKPHKKNMGSKVVVGPQGTPTPPKGPPTPDTGSDEGIPVPAGPYIPAGKSVIDPPPPTQETNPLAPGLDLRAHAANVGDIQVVRNSDLRSRGFFGIGAMPIAPSLNNGDGGEQSVATGPNGSAVMYTTNNADGISTDGGYTFTYLNPATAFGAASSPAGGFCCDQVVTYVPQVKRFVWILQYWIPGEPAKKNARGVNLIRVATATLHDFVSSRGTRWRLYDFSPNDFGLVRARKGQIEFDRPHVAFTRNNVYITVDDFRSATDFRGTVLWRINVRAFGRGSIGYQYIELPKASSKVRPAQDASSRDTVQYFAGEASTSRLNIYKWSDQANPITEYDMDVASIADRATDSRDPAGLNWMDRYGKQAGNVVTGAKTGNTLLFGWMFGREANVIRNGKKQTVTLHDQPGAGFVVINSDRDPPKKVAGESIAYKHIAAALPLLRANTNGETALSFMYGGHTLYPSHAVGFLIDYAVAMTVRGQATSIEPDYGGDYVGLTNVPGTQCFAAAGSATKTNTTRTESYIDPHYIFFGRTGDHCTNPRIPPPPTYPDLTIGSITSDTSQIAIAVKNTGKAAASASKLGYSFNGGAFQLADVRALAPGEIATAVFRCPSNGSVSVGAVGDDTHLVTESDETNNGSSATVNCVVAPPSQPDLVVTQVYGDQVNGSNECTIFADIQNVGTASTPATMTRFSDAASPPVDGVGFNSLVSTPALSPDQTTTVSFARNYGQDNTAVVTADATGLAAESHENNNTNTGFGFPSTAGRCRLP
jgi:hypothetical protein